MNTLSLHCLQGKLMSFGISSAQALFDYSEKEHKMLLPQAAQISQKHICLKIRNDWRVQGNGRDDGKIYPATYWKTSWPWAWEQQKPREGSTSYQTWEQTACWQRRTQTWQLWARSQLPLSCPGPPLCLSFGMGGKSAAPWMHSHGCCQGVCYSKLMALAPKHHFCTVSQHCSSCLTLRLLFLLAAFWTSSSCGHPCLGCSGLSELQHDTADETSVRHLWAPSGTATPVKPLHTAKSSPLLAPPQSPIAALRLHNKVVTVGHRTTKPPNKHPNNKKALPNQKK